MMNEEFKTIINTDIENCIKEIESGSIQDRYKLFKELTSKYNKIIDGFSEGLHTYYTDENGVARLRNLVIIKEKLILFKAMGYENAYNKEKAQIEINNSNSNLNNINIELSFNVVRERIENMSALPDYEINEILEKINLLEKIVESQDRKSKKWENAKDIVKWIADKGVDVGIAFLPLLLQIK